MKLTLDLHGATGKMWDLTMNYHNLPEPYAWEIGSAAANLSSYIENVTGGAAGEDKAYRMSLKIVAEGEEPKGAEKAATADRLLYSQVLEIQRAGVQLLGRLIESGDMEVKSGQRS